jgi:23S rRNA (guanosine2251-2'-O)-methyltransferase
MRQHAQKHDDEKTAFHGGMRSSNAGNAGEHEKNLCWGRHPVISLLEDNPMRCLKVTLSSSMQRSVSSKIIDLCRISNIPYVMVEARAIDAIIDANHQGVVAVVAPAVMLRIEEAVSIVPKGQLPAMAVMLDHVQDPHNLGAMIRSAEAASASFVALPLRRSSLPTGTVAKTSAGASLRLPLVGVGNVAAAVNEMKNAGLWVVGLDAGAEKSIYFAPLPARILIVAGGEGKGLGRTTSAACDEILSIPIRGKSGSLNASVALGVAMFEWARINAIT